MDWSAFLSFCSRYVTLPLCWKLLASLRFDVGEKEHESTFSFGVQALS